MKYRYKWTRIISNTLDTLELRMEEMQKHGIKTETLRRLCILNGTNVVTGDPEQEHAVECGLQQFMQSELQRRGYRSVKDGYFVNIYKCNDIEWMRRVLRNDAQDIKGRETVFGLLKTLIRKTCDGQYEIEIDESGNLIGYTPRMTEEEFDAELELDCI